MTLFELAAKNIKRNIKHYALYIGATVFSIIIYFTFATLKYSDNISGLAETSRQTKSIMSASAFVLMIFVAIFILYSNTFFMKKRKKEVALYSLLGVRKRTIGFLLFFENMMIGIISLVIGVVLGFFLSQLLLQILLKLMGMEMTLGLTISASAILNTVGVFFAIFLVTSLLGYRVIYQFKLIDLFQAAKKGEEQPKAQIIAVLTGVLALILAYWIALQDFVTSEVWRVLGIATPLVVIALTIIGSYLLFNSVFVYVLNKMKKREIWAWKGLNLMTASQLLYRIRGNAKTLTIIATLSATTITAGGAVFGMYYNTDKNIEAYAPFSFMWQGPQYEIQDESVEANIEFETKNIRVPGEEMDKEYYIIDQSTFTQLAKALEWDDIEQIHQKQTEALLIEPFYDERWSVKTEEVALGDDQYQIQKMYPKSIFNVEVLPGSVLVLGDEQYQALAGGATKFHAVQLDNYKKHADLSKQLASSLDTENFSSALRDYQESLKASGSQLFVGSFLGLVFLLATGSIIFFKMMTEAEEDKSKYEILYKIGVSKQEMKRTIRYQMGLVFIAPLSLGIMHGAVALTAFSNLLHMNLWEPVLWWMLAYTFVYIIYYFITVQGFYRTTIQEGN
ncbi:FtsX-like permease family protein [Bacillus sp. SD088]|uniref:FtsX-like permease family protein n=1 Tax=Bacillus sp. SD088 TaxID=2782012 RepID=UPI001A974389|nr:ABC transporter permease [Bacillus sp. SD088]MBO0994413.1 ABC transporter permease [Bacillus sp. SD088]